MKLLNGSLDYTTSGVASTAIDVAQINAAKLPDNGSTIIVVQVTGSAQLGEVDFTRRDRRHQRGDDRSRRRGRHRAALVRRQHHHQCGRLRRQPAQGLDRRQRGCRRRHAAIHQHRLRLGSVRQREDRSPASFADGKDFGKDAQVNINGAQAEVHGLTASLRTGDLDRHTDAGQDLRARRSIPPARASPSPAAGAKFQIGSEVNRQGQIDIGIGSVSTTKLGNEIDGFLSSLGSGGPNSLVGGNTVQAQKIITDAIRQVATLRGRLGALSERCARHQHQQPVGCIGKRDEQRKRHPRRRLRVGNRGAHSSADPRSGKHIGACPGQRLPAECAEAPRLTRDGSLNPSKAAPKGAALLFRRRPSRLRNPADVNESAKNPGEMLQQRPVFRRPRSRRRSSRRSRSSGRSTSSQVSPVAVRWPSAVALASVWTAARSVDQSMPLVQQRGGIDGVAKSQAPVSPIGRQAERDVGDGGERGGVTDVRRRNIRAVDREDEHARVRGADLGRDVRETPAKIACRLRDQRRLEFRQQIRHRIARIRWIEVADQFRRRQRTKPAKQVQQKDPMHRGGPLGRKCRRETRLDLPSRRVFGDHRDRHRFDRHDGNDIAKRADSPRRALTAVLEMQNPEMQKPRSREGREGRREGFIQYVVPSRFPLRPSRLRGCIFVSSRAAILPPPMTEHAIADLPSVSIIIPIWNDAAQLPGCSR